MKFDIITPDMVLVFALTILSDVFISYKCTEVLLMCEHVLHTFSSDDAVVLAGTVDLVRH